MSLFIHWNVSEEIFSIGSFPLRWYGLLFATGFIVGYQIMKRFYIHEKVNIEHLDSLLMYLVIGTIVGARLGHCLFYDWDYFQNHLVEMFLPISFEPSFHFTGYRGLASHGGAIGILIAMYIYSKRIVKKHIFWIMDRVLIPIALTGMFIRMGNLMNSEIIGLPTDVPWAFIFEKVDNQPRHPVQLYEAISYLLIFLILWRMYWKTDLKDRLGKIFGWFLVLIWSARFVLEYFKNSQGGFEDVLGNVLTTGQWLSIPFIIAGVILIARK